MTQLPPSVELKLRRLTYEAEDAQAILNNLPMQIARIEREIENHSQVRATWPEGSEEYKLLGDKLRELEAEKEALKETQARRHDEVKEVKQVVLQINRWLSTLPQGVKLVPVETPKPKVTTDNLAQAVTAARQEIEALKSQIRQLRSKPLPAEDMKARARAYVEHMAATAHPTVEGWVDGKFRVKFPGNADPLTPLACTAPEYLIAWLESQVDETEPDKDAMPADEKAARLKSLEDLLLKAERQEEALVTLAKEHGVTTIFRRWRADARAILEVDVLTPSEAAQKSLADEQRAAKTARKAEAKAQQELDAKALRFARASA